MDPAKVTTSVTWAPNTEAGSKGHSGCQLLLEAAEPRATQPDVVRTRTTSLIPN